MLDWPCKICHSMYSNYYSSHSTGSIFTGSINITTALNVTRRSKVTRGSQNYYRGSSRTTTSPIPETTCRYRTRAHISNFVYCFFGTENTTSRDVGVVWEGLLCCCRDNVTLGPSYSSHLYPLHCTATTREESEVSTVL